MSTHTCEWVATAHNRRLDLDKLEAENDRLREVNAELVEVLKVAAQQRHYAADHGLAFEDCYSAFCHEAIAAIERASGTP